jgi:CheY-like chemotaxis protein
MGQRVDSRHVILVVDDQQDNREILSAVLSGRGHRVIEACNGLEAVKLAARERPDLIIMDLSMPVMDGFGAMRLLRELPQVQQVPVVACTAHDTTSHKLQALGVGFNEFLTKPIDFRKLDLVLNQFLKAA